MPSPRQDQGLEAQHLAQAHLEAAGLHLAQANANFKVGEIDLVMWEANTLVFVEVRARASSAFGGALASITPAKQAKLRRAAQTYLLKVYGSRAWPSCRFDVVALQGGGPQPELQWIKGAF